MLKRMGLPVATMILAGCASNLHPGTSDNSYRKLTDEYVQAHLAWNPQEGTSLGLHQYDGRITDLSRASIDAEHARLTKFRELLAAIDDEMLSPRISREKRI